MDDFFHFLLESSTIAFIVTLAIFIVTLWLVVKRSIGFFITLLLLLFALVSGFFVANQDILRSLVKGYVKEGSKEASPDAYTLLKEQLEKSYGEFKKDILEQKDEFQELFSKIRSENKEGKELPSSPNPSNGIEKKKETK